MFRITFCCFLFMCSAYSEKPMLKLPFSAGQIWSITVGYGGSDYHQNDDFYALDFNLPGDSDLGQPILAAASGEIFYAGWMNGYGWTVIIDHGYGYKTRYAHLNLAPTVSGRILQGQEIGKCGSSGGTSTGPHLHFVMYFNGGPEIPEPMSGYANFQVGGRYVSDNFFYSQELVIGYHPDGSISQPILDYYSRPEQNLGQPFDNGGGLYVHDWSSQDGTTKITLQDFCLGSPGVGTHCAIVESVDGNAYSLKGAFRWYYMQKTYDGMPFDAVKLLGPPINDGGATVYYPILPDGTFDCVAGKTRCYVTQSFANGYDFVWDGSKVWLVQNVCGLNKALKSVDFDCNGQPYEFQIAGSLPAEPGCITLHGAANCSTGVYLEWSDTLYQSQFYRLWSNGQLRANVGARGYSDYPLWPSTTYRYQVEAITFSGMSLGFSNEIVVTTPESEQEPGGDLGEPFPARIEATLSECLWVWGQTSSQNGIYLTAQVFDQYGQLMPNEEVVFTSSKPLVFCVNFDSGWCSADDVGQAEVWAQHRDWSGIRSQRIAVTVVNQLPPEPIEPDVYESSGLKLENFNLLSQGPFVEYCGLFYSVLISNPTDQPITFYGPQLYHFDLNGKTVGDSPYSIIPTTLQPGQSQGFADSGGQIGAAGEYYLMAMVNFDGQYASPRYVIDDCAAGISSKIYVKSVSQDDLKADLQAFDLYLDNSAPSTNDLIGLNARVFNFGRKKVDASFSVSIEIRGIGSQFCEVAGLEPNSYESCNMFFGPLPAGAYTADLIVDSQNSILEENEGNNVAHLPFTVSSMNLPPVIITDLADKTVAQGSKVIFEVLATIADPPNDQTDLPISYQWQHNGQEVIANNSSQLILENVGFDQAGSYACVVTTANGFAASSRTAILTVLPKLKITSQPQVLTLFQGQALENCLQAVGAGTLSYQWYKDGKIISGQNQPCLKIASVLTSDSGFYHCRVTDVAAGLTQRLNTKVVQLSVRQVGSGAPAVYLEYVDGESVITGRLQANQWALGGLLLNPYSLPAKKTYADVQNLGLRFTQSKEPKVCLDDGEQILLDENGNSLKDNLYDGIGFDATRSFEVNLFVGRTLYCRLRPYLIISGKVYYLNLEVVKIYLNGNELAVSNGQALLYLATVNPQLQITLQPIDRTVKTGANLYFKVAAVGDPVITYAWFKDGQAVPSGNKAILRLLGVCLDAAGEYSCLVKTSAGKEVWSLPARLTVYQKLQILSQPVSVALREGDSGFFEVEAIGQGELFYQWRKDGKKILGANQSCLEFESVAKSQIGSYTCLVSDSCPGTAQRLLSQAADLSILPEMQVVVCVEKIDSEFIECQPSARANPGQTVHFSCQVQNGIAPFSYQWFFNGDVLPGEIGSTLVKTEVSNDEEGAYNCQVTDSSG